MKAIASNSKSQSDFGLVYRMHRAVGPICVASYVAVSRVEMNASRAAVARRLRNARKELSRAVAAVVERAEA